MRIINYLADLLFRHQKKLEIIAIFLLFLTISFRITDARTIWLWNEHAFLALILVIFLMVLALIWIQIEKKKTKNLIELIKEETLTKTNTKNQIEELSLRQKEVFDLIVAGKSNKEIMSELSIELSTLKTHINKIYKMLEIDSRKQLRQYKNPDN